MRTTPERAANANLWWQACPLHEEEFVAADTAASTEQNPRGKEHT
jgi:hypothetical protein